MDSLILAGELFGTCHLFSLLLLQLSSMMRSIKGVQRHLLLFVYIEKLSTFLLSASDKEFADFFAGTEAANFAFKNNDKTTHSIRSVLSAQIEGLRQLGNSETAFSIRDWVRNEKHTGFLFITARADQRQTLTPLISAWVDMAINALMILPENYERRLWFVIDELAALQRLPRLQTGLAEGRKYGACFLVGFQSKPQLEDIYGRNQAESMLDLFNTKLFFRCTEPSSQQWISRGSLVIIEQ